MGEIEAAVNSIEKVKGCACVYNRQTDSLVLYYEGGPRDTGMVNGFLLEKVPNYMMPDRIIRINELPKNANGKIDRKQLIEQLTD